MSSPGLFLAQDVLEPRAPCFLFCTPVGPNTPFSTPLLAALDTARVLCVVVGIVVVVSILRILLRPQSWSQRCTFAALAMYALVAIDTRLEHLGDYPSARTGLDIVATLLAAAGLLLFYLHEEWTDRGGP